jgi:hypothetical protein
LLGNFLKTPWSDGALTFGWTNTGTGLSWASPGIGAGDLQGPSFQLGGIDASGYQRRTIALDPASVQNWVRNGATNQGLVLANQDTGKVLRLYSSEASNVAQRPTLSVTYH